MDYHEQLSQKFIDVYWLMHRYHQAESIKEDHALDPHQGQGRILLLLQNAKEMSQKDICSILNVRSQSVGEMIKKLEKNGYVTRTPSEDDRRVMMLYLTEKGEKATVSDFSFAEVFDCLNNQEEETLVSYLDKIRDTLVNKLEIDFDNTEDGRIDADERISGRE